MKDRKITKLTLDDVMGMDFRMPQFVALVGIDGVDSDDIFEITGSSTILMSHKWIRTTIKIQHDDLYRLKLEDFKKFGTYKRLTGWDKYSDILVLEK